MKTIEATNASDAIERIRGRRSQPDRIWRQKRLPRRGPSGRCRTARSVRDWLGTSEPGETAGAMTSSSMRSCNAQASPAASNLPYHIDSMLMADLAVMQEVTTHLEPGRSLGDSSSSLYSSLSTHFSSPLSSRSSRSGAHGSTSWRSAATRKHARYRRRWTISTVISPEPSSASRSPLLLLDGSGSPPSLRSRQVSRAVRDGAPPAGSTRLHHWPSASSS